MTMYRGSRPWRSEISSPHFVDGLLLVSSACSRPCFATMCHTASSGCCTRFQLVHMLKGWIEFDYVGQGVVRMEVVSCVYQPLGIRQGELGHSADVELLEVVMPGGFSTDEVAAFEARAT
jgi:hypothetical protein